ncbi:hypothetical protein SO802_022610 [Lithocarpus litseifolius]|uniref:MATH domain-containing protein n=1 Tax=Lithocarpus litseifolius TaxID=425828 RepID=A0AAW2C495_9ROSI
MVRIVSPNSLPIFSSSSSSSSSSLSWSTPTTTSTSTSMTETVNASHLFNISGYPLLKGIGIGNCVTSDTFTAGGHSWAIYFYPDGKKVQYDAPYVSLFIVLASEGTDVRAVFELKLLDQSGKGRHKVHTQFESGPYTIRNRGSMWGCERFFKRTDLESSDYLKDDCLKVHCSVGVVRSYTKGPKIYSIAVPPSNIGQNLGQLFETGKGTDVNLEVDGETFAAHCEGHSSDYEGSSPERTASQPSSHVEDPSGSFLERYPQFPPWSCQVKNQDGSIRCMQHERPKQAPNVPWTCPRAQLAESLIQTLVKWFEGLRVGVGPSQRDNEGGSRSRGTRSSRQDNGGGSGSGMRLSRRRTLKSSRRRTQGPSTPSNEDENNQLGQFLTKQRNLLFLVFLFMFMFMFFLFLFFFFCLFVFLFIVK